MPTDWKPIDETSRFEQIKDETYKRILGKTGQWVKFQYADSCKLEENIFAYFERDHEEITIGADVSFSSQDTIVECRYSDFDNVPTQGDGVTVVETLGEVKLTMYFKITDRHEPDEQGAIMFVLELINAVRTKNGNPVFTSFVMEVNADDGVINLPLDPEINYNFTVNWGDDSGEKFNGAGLTSLSHTYAAPGVYSVCLVGPAIGVNYVEGVEAEKVLNIKSWGNSPWVSLRFEGCSNLSIVAGDVPNLSNLNSLYNGFRNAFSLDNIPNLNNWDVSNVENFESLFARTQINQPLGNWDVSSAVTLRAMLALTPFNQDVSAWDVSNVVDFSILFFDTNFNQDVSAWDVSSGENFEFMFMLSDFAQDVSAWDVSSALSLRSMFNACDNFNSDLSNWDVSSA